MIVKDIIKEIDREKELEEKGFHVFRVKQMRESLIGHYRQLKEIMKRTMKFFFHKKNHKKKKEI